MTLHPIVKALGGDLYCGGSRASIPAPGHSAQDRSVSLWLTDGRVVIHGFGAADWRTARDDLRARGFIDDAGRLTGGGSGGSVASHRPDTRRRVDTAARLWACAVDLTLDNPAGLHLRRRAVIGGGGVRNLGLLRAAPLSVYRQGGLTLPAMIARISDGGDRLTAVELTYLRPNGLAAAGLRLGRKTVGLISPGAAVRLAPTAEEMLAAEGVVTTLSAMDRFGLAGFALLSANNLAAWTPPPVVRRLLIAADRGLVGEAAADRLRRRLARPGLEIDVACPEEPFGDWNDVAVAERSQREERGR